MPCDVRGIAMFTGQKLVISHKGRQGSFCLEGGNCPLVIFVSEFGPLGKGEGAHSDWRCFYTMIPHHCIKHG